MEDKVAYELYNKLAYIIEQPDYIHSDEWTNNETTLLNWSIHQYCEKKGITLHDLNPSNWATISGFVPGRGFKECEAKFAQGLYLV